MSEHTWIGYDRDLNPGSFDPGPDFLTTDLHTVVINFKDLFKIPTFFSDAWGGGNPLPNPGQDPGH
jgi:hypothetical protein